METRRYSGRGELERLLVFDRAIDNQASIPCHCEWRSGFSRWPCRGRNPHLDKTYIARVYRKQTRLSVGRRADADA
jgi:hypothetical protein